VDLHPYDAVEETLRAHHDALAIVGRDLDLALQSVAARFDDVYPDLWRMPGSALAANLRMVFGATTELRVPGASTLRLVETNSGNDAIHLYDPGKRRIRIRKYPLSPKDPTRALQATPPPDTLFGPDLFHLAYEIAVLWVPDYKAKAIRRSVLAAVEHLDEWEKTSIYHEVDLPTRPSSGGGPAYGTEDDEGFEDDFREGEEGVGPS
jgi:hypothetical protein